VPDLPVDDLTAAPTDWSGVHATFKAELEGYFRRIRQRPDPVVHAANSRYYAEWLTRIASSYRAHGIPVLIFEVPRGPWHGQLKPAPAPVGEAAALVAANLVVALQGDSFVGLEQPRYFFDSAHMNREGRERFSPMLARRIADVLH
jgi:lysophospholipase L1-like esterase